MKKRDKGFTLLEVLVVVAILALLAAAILPIVLNQLQRGDPVRLSTDMTDLQSAVRLFRLDVRPSRIPGDLEDLTQPIDSLDADVTNEPYSRREMDRWDGPYVDFQFPFLGIARPDTTHLSTGFAGRIHTDLILFDISADPGIHARTDADGDTIPVDAPLANLEANRDWAAVAVSGLDETDFESANDEVDGPGEADGSLDGESQWEGSLRYDDDLGMTFFLIVPLKQRP